MLELLDRMAEEIAAAVSFLEDDSKSERRRVACLESFKATLEEYGATREKIGTDQRRLETERTLYRNVLEETRGVLQVASSRGDPYTLVDQAWLDRRIARINRAL